MGYYTAFQIANAFIDKCNRDDGDSITNLKLQKYLYYCQGYYLGMYGESLFDEGIEKWYKSPVVPEVFHYYDENYGFESIPADEATDHKEELDEQTVKFIDELYSILEEFSAIKLMRMVNMEPPVANAELKQEISTEEMQQYFRNFVEETEDDE